MRILSILLLVRVLLLSCAPCNDSIDSFSQNTIVKILDTSGTDCDGDSCSPFCSCSCCIAGACSANSRVYRVKPVHTIYTNYYIDPSCNSINKTILQPPKVA